MPFDPTQPYNDLPGLPPAVDVETTEVLKACIEGHRSLAALRAATRSLPDPNILINPIALLEAQASSEIENIVTTNDALFRQAAMDENMADPATKEALRYRRALFEGYAGLKHRPLSTGTAVEICRTIKGSNIDIRRIPGTTLRNTTSGEIVYTPPVGEEVIRTKLADWERFIHGADQLDPLVKMAVQHYQFEAIHPFLDGNGRTGRVLNILFLIEQGVLDYPILYLSREILAFRSQYYENLQLVTAEGAWAKWVRFFVLLTALSATRTMSLVRDIEVMMADMQMYLELERHKVRVPVVELISAVYRAPYTRIVDLVSLGVAKRQTASEYLNKLVELGILESRKIGREKIFFNARLFMVLTGRAGEVRALVPGPDGHSKLLFGS